MIERKIKKKKKERERERGERERERERDRERERERERERGGFGLTLMRDHFAKKSICADDKSRFAPTATEECSVGRGGVLTMFNGQTSTVAVPCKYRLAFFQCGDYKVRVTPGSKLDSNNLFSPTTVRLSIKRISTNEKVAVRTGIRRWQNVKESNFF